jgi:hypothetical protein
MEMRKDIDSRMRANPEAADRSKGDKVRTGKINWAFWLTATTVCILNLVLWRMGKQGSGFPSPGHFILCGILGLAALNCVAFTIPLLSAMKDAGKIDERELTREQQEEEVEQVMLPALQGRRDPPERTDSIIRLLFWICVGLIVGSIAAWVIEFNVAKFTT